MQPFWPRHSPHFLACRRAVRPFDGPATIGLSGGPDSLALVAAAAAEGKDAHAVVIDHGLQPGSSAVASKAAAQARELGVPATVVEVALRPGNIEAAAREARYEALLSFGREVWVAHTADDQAETLLLGALRGNPSGMSARGRVTRPFLGLRRADTVGACAELGITPWDDPMNSDPAYRRVAMRRDVIPLLSSLVGGDVVPALAATANRIAEDRELIETLVDTSATPSCAALATEPAPVRRRRLLAWLQSEGVGIGGAQLLAVERLITHWRGQGPVALSGGVAVRRVGGVLEILRK
ncbi:tRNA lysidine(34) synthetase TilS [Corynebacterium liangguodongii]|uniref:tRNA(Ile)-lysidine synthase n=1 Tax=Corynebacterium liangguodongii TaxID=2079535 RepID=A0A2S0WFW3_9CORY|nr:tRNA lysidine(34) synthetase TilS [Corynebacterium liangguodongii]AWB84665.1 tRNA lysidine(34) synthetase TilS [Corynebacterium liangguodongii]PWB99673.1 tRNA lysidine(34) synthetase TilS [Corynebacterium liangguodongii]